MAPKPCTDKTHNNNNNNKLKIKNLMAWIFSQHGLKKI
jgi:hypothetical protein